VAKHKTIQKTHLFLKGVQHALNYHCTKTRKIINLNGNEVLKDTTMI
jgi:hypothetical protein